MCRAEHWNRASCRESRVPESCRGVLASPSHYRSAQARQDDLEAVERATGKKPEGKPWKVAQGQQARGEPHKTQGMERSSGKEHDPSRVG